ISDHQPRSAGVANRESNRTKVLFNNLCSFWRAFYKRDAPRSAAQGLDPYSSGAGAHIEKRRSLDDRREDVEQGLAQSIGCGSHLEALNGPKTPPAIGSRDDPHSTCDSKSAKFKKPDARDRGSRRVRIKVLSPSPPVLAPVDF